MSQAGPLAVVIDDDPLVAEAMGLTVKDWGAEVVIAISLERALHAIGDRGGAINWIITDFDLGGGADGFEAVQRLKALSPGDRALVLSG
ncbi:MAG: response regulator, partial [Terricaulis silvestris]